MKKNKKKKENFYICLQYMIAFLRNKVWDLKVCIIHTGTYDWKLCLMPFINFGTKWRRRSRKNKKKEQEKKSEKKKIKKKKQNFDICFQYMIALLRNKVWDLKVCIIRTGIYAWKLWLMPSINFWTRWRRRSRRRRSRRTRRKIRRTLTYVFSIWLRFWETMFEI